MDKGNKIVGEDFIIFGEDFNRHPHALEHVLRPLFAQNRFLWIETIGLRSPRLSIYDFKRIVEKIVKWIKCSEKNISENIPKNVTVMSPFMIPFNQFGAIRKFNRWNVVRKIKRFIALNEMSHPVSIASVPNACDFIGAFEEKLRIYYCVDEFSLWPGLKKEFVQKLEAKLIQNVDVIIATSEFLSNSKKISGQETLVITHGVDFDHFNLGSNKQIIPAINKLKLCCFGLFDERTNQGLLKDIAEQIDNCEIHIFGNVVCRMSEIKEQANIFFHGKVNYLDLPLAIKEMDIFLLPYVKNELTNNINPLKLKEYLTTGRPVVAIDLPEVVKLSEYLFVARNSQDFIDVIYGLQSGRTIFNPDKVIKYVKENETWEIKAKILSLVIETTKSLL